jgi:hypothetical protein
MKVRSGGLRQALMRSTKLLGSSGRAEVRNRREMWRRSRPAWVVTQTEGTKSSAGTCRRGKGIGYPG